MSDCPICDAIPIEIGNCTLHGGPMTMIERPMSRDYVKRGFYAWDGGPKMRWEKSPPRPPKPTRCERFKPALGPILVFAGWAVLQWMLWP
jgi:hypothetical protein